MKKSFKFLTILVATLLLISSLPLAAFAYETEDAENVIDEILDTEYSDTIASEYIETEDSSETEISETEETETITFEFSEEDCLMNNARVIGDGEVGFGPPEEDTEAVQITSLEVPEGVYSLQNLGSALWMNIEQSKIYAGYHVQQTSSSENPANAFTRASLFKISEKSDGQYIIRLMTNNKLSFAFDGNTVKTKEISPIDSEVADADTFTITCISGNYVIRPYGTSYTVSANNSSDAYLTKRNLAQAGDYAKWKLYRYKGDYSAGTTIVYTASYKNKGIPVGTSGTIYNITWSTEIGTNYPYMAVADGHETMMDSEWLDTIQKLSFEAISPGNVKIYSMICRSNTTAYQHRGYTTFQVIPREGTYVIKNEGSDKYVDINGSSTSEGALINQSSFSTEDSQKWIIEHVSNGQGYVRIKSLYSNKYLGIDSTTNTTIKQTSTLDNYSLWKFERTTAGNLKLVCKALATTKVLAIPTGSSMNNNGTNLTTVTYTANSEYNDEWELNRILPLSGYELDYDATKWDTYVESCCNCYAYALNNQVLPGTNYLWFMQQMGHYYDIDYECSNYTESIIYQDVCNDVGSYNTTFGTSLIFQRIGRYETCPPGTYKVALVFKPATNTDDKIDYHWYRQDSDGLWSHKPGTTAVKRTDESGDLIFDPYTADRGGYTEFLGYYAVTPWNNMFTEGNIIECYYFGYTFEYWELMYLLSQYATYQNSNTVCYLDICAYNKSISKVDKLLIDEIINKSNKHKKIVSIGVCINER